jgi:hypothetical protein
LQGNQLNVSDAFQQTLETGVFVASLPLAVLTDGGSLEAESALEAGLGDTVVEGEELEQGGLNLFKWNDSTSTTATGWRQGDYFLNLPNQGSAQANWIQNSSSLRSVMSQGNPIFDSYIDSTTGELIPTRGFLNAERNLLENHNWQFNPATGAWHPPLGQ